jgi:hypothetical protein
MEMMILFPRHICVRPVTANHVLSQRKGSTELQTHDVNLICAVLLAAAAAATAAAVAAAAAEHRAS